MDAIKYFEEAVRMRKSSSGCENCLFNKGFDEHPVFPCRSSLSCKERVAIEKCVSIVEKWSVENPIKTRQSEFLKLHPNAKISSSGVLAVCPLHIDTGAVDICNLINLNDTCEKCCKEYWLAEVCQMNDDLISRRTIKSLIEMIRDCWAISPYVSANDMKLYSKVFNVVLNEISNCPTAFDKEKVIEELVELRQREYNNSDDELETLDGEEIYDEGRSQGRFETYHRAIEIVEKGGIG